MPGKSPSFVMKSLWQMPQACTRMRTCPAPGFGISRSTISKSAPGFGTCATFIFAIETLHFLFWIHAKNFDARLAQSDTLQCATKERKKKKFCRDFRSDAQARQLTHGRLPRTMPRHSEQGSVRCGNKNPPHLPIRGDCDSIAKKKRIEKGPLFEYLCLLTQP